MNEEIKIEEWIVVTGGKTYLGRALDVEHGRFRALRDHVVRAMAEHKPIALSPAFEFSSPVMSNAKGDLERKAFAFAPDMALSGVPVYVSPLSFYLCDDLEKGDREVYVRLISQALERARVDRARRSGLELPGRP